MIWQSAADRPAGGDAMSSTLAGDYPSGLPLPGGENGQAQAPESSAAFPDTAGARAPGETSTARKEKPPIAPSTPGGSSFTLNGRVTPPVAANPYPPADSAAAGNPSTSMDRPAGETGAAGGEKTVSDSPAEKPQAKPAAKKGWLSVAAWPSAEIHVDGRYIGDTPPTISVELTRGYHKLECKNPMHETYSEEIKIINGELSQRNITLKKLRAQISLAATEGAEFYVDGTLVGITPIMEPITIDAGKHHLTLKRAGFHIWNSEITIQANQVLPLKIVLSPQY
jgi:serine/threonine-protein kinase